MSENDVNAILVRLAGFEARVTGRLDALGKENTDAGKIHEDHESRIRGLERVRWIATGAALLVGSGLGAVIAQFAH